MSKSRESSSPARKANRAKSYATGKARKAQRVERQAEQAKLNAGRGYTPRELTRALRWLAGDLNVPAQGDHEHHAAVIKNARGVRDPRMVEFDAARDAA